MSTCRRTTRTHRHGHTLVELLAVVSINSVLMALAVWLLGTLLRADSRGQHHFERSSAIVRLADRLRSDVAASRGATIVPSEQSQPSLSNALRLQGEADQTIEFSRDGDRVRRAEYQGTNVVRREAYTLADLSEARFVVSESRLVSVRLNFGQNANVAHGDWQIDAQLGRDWRFAEEDER